MFLGFVNFYRRFIEGFFHIARPLFNLTKNNSNFHWSSDEQSTFDLLKEKITSVPMLALPNNLKPFHIEVDSSDFATGAVLSQQSLDDDKWHLVAFLSKSLSPVEKNYNMVLLTPDFFAIQALEGLEVWGEEKDILKEIQCEMQSRNKEEVVVKAIKGLMKSSAKSVKSLEWSLDNGILYHREDIYVPNSNLCCCISTLCHNSKLAGHAGRWKTLELVFQNYWWSSWRSSINFWI